MIKKLFIITIILLNLSCSVIPKEVEAPDYTGIWFRKYVTETSIKHIITIWLSISEDSYTINEEITSTYSGTSNIYIVEKGTLSDHTNTHFSLTKTYSHDGYQLNYIPISDQQTRTVSWTLSENQLTLTDGVNVYTNGIFTKFQL